MVPGEDGIILRGQGWVAAGPGMVIKHSGATSARPIPDLPGELYLDTTLGILAIYGGPKTGWLNACTGASA